VTLRLDDAVLLGSSARAWPEPGCGCVTCTSGSPGPALGLDVGGALVLDGGRPAPGGAVHLATGGLAATPAGARVLVPGDKVAHGALRVVALPGPLDAGRSGGGVAAVLSDGHDTWLWAPGCGPLPTTTLDVLAGAALRVATADVRDCGGVPAATHAAHRLADLRRAGALAEGARVVAVGLSHDGPAVRRLVADLCAAGVGTVRPGTRVLAAAADDAAAARPRRTLVLGPASSGKSRVAEDLLAAEPAVVYAATGPEPDGADAEWAAKVAAHADRRPAGWRTVAVGGAGALPVLLAGGGPPVLLDSLGTWVAAVLDRAGAWADAPPQRWRAQVDEEVAQVVRAWRSTAREVVAVGEEVGWGVVPATRSGRVFASVLGDLTRRLADQSERTLLVVAGRAVDLDAVTADASGSLR
jgi:adenosylcobinamide kinase/adenosylcobinamide-phosphate guanylyltransferase